MPYSVNAPLSSQKNMKKIRPYSSTNILSLPLRKYEHKNVIFSII